MVQLQYPRVLCLLHMLLRFCGLATSCRQHATYHVKQDHGISRRRMDQTAVGIQSISTRNSEQVCVVMLLHHLPVTDWKIQDILTLDGERSCGRSHRINAR